jgi:hypothetical protein
MVAGGTDEIPPPHSMTSLAHASSNADIVSPRALAVLRLLIDENFVSGRARIARGFRASQALA